MFQNPICEEEGTCTDNDNDGIGMNNVSNYWTVNLIPRASKKQGNLQLNQ